MPILLLTAEEWRAGEQQHAERVDRLTAAHRDRRSRGEKHPVEDFLFTYYPLSLAALRRWHPGPGVRLADAPDRADWKHYRDLGGGAVEVDVASLPVDRLAQVRRLLAATASRPARLGCFGLHEWAMVYRAPQTRHAAPLRLGGAGTDAVVESHPLRCTHFDAFRFFTDEAVGRNARPLTRADQVETEQPGCLHAGMDLYKWAGRLGPACPSELLADCFELAGDVRRLDMAASPYNLSAYGVVPVPVETPSGRTVYVAAQRGFAERGAGLRSRLLSAYDAVLSR